MIITEYVEQKITQKNLEHFLILGYECKIGDIIKVKPEQLTLGSHQKIDVTCDICGKINKVIYRGLRKMLDKHGYFSCAGKCSSKKTEQTKLKNYGVTNNSKLDSWKEVITNAWKGKTKEEITEIKNKSNETYRKKTGYDNPAQNPETRDKFKKTCLERYGVENPSYNEEIKEKRVQTKIKNFGKINNSQTASWRLDVSNYWNNISQSEKEDIVKRRKNTNLEIYGFENPINSPLIIEKIKQNNLQKYGVESHNQNQNIHRNQQISGLKRKKFKETDLTYQGSYELDFLSKYYEKLEITEIDSIVYSFNEKNSHYFPDFYITKYNTIVEIKSTYYYKLYLDKNLSKKEASIKKGFNFIFIIDKDYTEFENLLKSGHGVV